MRHGKVASGIAFAAGLAAFGVGAPALAQSPMRAPFRPADWTDVTDAFDGEDPFDLNLGIGYTRSLRRGKIRREVAGNVEREGGDGEIISGDGYIDYLDIANHRHLTHTLNLELAFGVWHDLEIWGALPLILSDTRELDYVPGTNDEGVRQFGLSCPPDAIANGANYTHPGCNFDLPFKSPERSGIDTIGVGIDWGPLNQGRDGTKPTFVIRGEAWFSVGDPLVADRSGVPVTPSAPSCADVSPGSVACLPDNYNPGVDDESAGISRGTTKLGAAMLFSHRFRYVEPYSGLNFSAEFPGDGTEFPQLEEEGRLNTVPPIVGAFTAGVEVIPWENPDQFQRFALDIRVGGEFHSEGRDYSELFDALGTSTSRRLLQPEAATQSGPAANDLNNPWSGQTDVQNYGIYSGRVGLNLQAAQYIKFNLGIAYAFVQEHSLTVTDACNPDANVDVAHVPCTEGAPNPDHRPEIDLPGRRYRIEDANIFDVFVSATAMF